MAPTTCLAVAARDDVADRADRAQPRQGWDQRRSKRTLGLAGITAAQLEADNAQSFRLIDVQARFGGLDLIVIGLLLSAILVGAFRHNERWSWWAMWLLPLWGVSVFATILRTGVAADQAPPSPYFSGPIIAALSSALLIVAAPRFFGRRTAGDAATSPATGG